MKNPLKLFWIDFDELFPVWVIWTIFSCWIVFFWLWGLGSKMWFVYTWLWLIAISIIIFILTNISQAVRLFNEWKVTKASFRLIFTVWLILLAIYLWYNAYLSFMFY